MNIDWLNKYPDDDIHEGKTNTKFWVQIAPSTEPEEYVWIIFHTDSGFAQWGGSEKTIEEAMKTSEQWLIKNSKTWQVTNPKV